MEDKIKKLELWVKENYSPYKCAFTSERSSGNYDDCFDDGAEMATSYSAYEVGCMLGMDLEEPEYPSEEE